ncbi:unnamed protein product [Caretta caretta]
MDSNLGPHSLIGSLNLRCRRNKSIPDHSAVDSGTPPGREAEAESTGEQQPSIPRREDAKMKVMQITSPG